MVYLVTAVYKNELARKAGVSRYRAPSTPRRIIRVTYRGIEAILGGRQTAALTVEIFRQPIPLDWAEQRLMLGFVD